MAYRFIRKPSRHKFVRVFPSAKSTYHIIKVEENVVPETPEPVVEEAVEQPVITEEAPAAEEAPKPKKRASRKKKVEDNTVEPNGE